MIIFFFLVKRETIKLQSFELGLLKGYKMYLQKLERLAKVYNPKKGDSSVRTEVSYFKYNYLSTSFYMNNFSILF